jgi:hypothetical protein
MHSSFSFRFFFVFVCCCTIYRESEAKNTCFICGIERHDFDRMIPAGTSLGFAHHRGSNHNPLNYMAFIMNIWKQSESEDSSLEIYVRDCLKRGYVGWFPSSAMHELESLVEAQAIDESAVRAIPLTGKGGQDGNGKHGKHGSSNGGHDPEDGGGGGHSAAGAVVSNVRPRERGDSGVEESNPNHTIHGSISGPSTSAHSSRRPRTAGGNVGVLERDNAELIDRMQSMQQQLISISKNMVATSQFPTNIPFSDDRLPPISPKRAPIAKESDPAVLTAVSQLNDAMMGMMKRIDHMEKNLTKSHKYLRSRLRTNNHAKTLPHPLSNSPTRALLQMKHQRSKGESARFASNNDEPDEEVVSELNRDEVLIKVGDSVDGNLLMSNDENQANPATYVLPSQSSLERLRPGSHKLENSYDSSEEDDDEESLRTAESDHELEHGIESPNIGQTQQQLNRPMLFNRPNSAVVIRNVTTPQNKARPQSAKSTNPCNTPPFAGPPKSLIEDVWK